MRKMESLIGQRFGKLLVIGDTRKYLGSDGMPRGGSVCRCDCGNIITVRNINLKNGSNVSCGCYRKIKGVKGSGKRTGTRLYAIWQNIKKRCTNKNDPSWRNYGERGIGICKEWEDYETFKTWALNNGYSEKLTIDRIDNDKGYSPDNCRWATHKQQANNLRKNVRIEYGGETHTMSEWSDITGIKYTTIRGRLRNKWPIERALTEGVNIYG